MIMAVKLDGPWIDIGFPPPIMVVTTCHWQQYMASGFLCLYKWDEEKDASNADEGGWSD